MNIILLIIDTLRYDYVGANGNNWIQTPNLDRLAAESWFFDNSYCASYPTIPFRTDVITGRYGAPFHVWRPLPFDAVTLPQTLARLGYATQLIHDTPHLVNGGHNFDYPFHAWTFVRGAEVDRPWIGSEGVLPPNWGADPTLGIKAEESLPALPPLAQTYAWANARRSRHEDWNCARLFLTAREFLRDNQERDNFFLWLDCFDPHEPWDSPPEFRLMYDTTAGYDGRHDPRVFTQWLKEPDRAEELKQRARWAYAAKVTWMDHWVGRLLDDLEESGLREKTALIVTGDHGTNDGTGVTGAFHKGFPVREPEGHIPTMIRAPGAGSGRSDLIMQPQDLFATILALAGGTAPRTIESHDVLGLASEGKASPRALALAGSPPNGWEGRDILFTTFDGEWSLEFAVTPEKSALRRMGENADCAGEHPDVVRRLHTTALGELARRGADPAVLHWIDKRGEVLFPRTCRYHEGYPAPSGYAVYFTRLFAG